MRDYNEAFRSIVLMGVTSGLRWPLEWAINAHRTPGATMLTSYYEELEGHLPRFLCEMYEAECLEQTTDANDILEWADHHYVEGHLARGYFGFLRDKIDEYVRDRYGENQGKAEETSEE